MTREGDIPTLEHRVVLVFDICSSTTILEDLKSTDNLYRWRDLLIGLKTFLILQGAELKFEIYKFIGDGWILLFPRDISKNQLLDFICELDTEFYLCFDHGIREFLQRIPTRVGVTAGVDSGELIRLEMNEQWEYLGRAINVATRLQGATKDLASSCGDKVLFSRNSYSSLGDGRAEFRVKEAQVQLRNISNGDNYVCLEWDILT
jgi:class 3 adenylate cyclase